MCASASATPPSALSVRDHLHPFAGSVQQQFRSIRDPAKTTIDDAFCFLASLVSHAIEAGSLTRDTTAEARLGVSLVLLVSVATSRTATHFDYNEDW